MFVLVSDNFVNRRRTSGVLAMPAIRASTGRERLRWVCRLRQGFG